MNGIEEMVGQHSGLREQRVLVQVCALGKRNNDNVWVATEGVYFPTKEA